VFENAEEVEDVLACVAPSWVSARASASTGRPVVAVKGERPGSFSVSAPWFDEPIRGLTAVAAACSILVDLARSWLEANPAALCLHAAAFAIDGKLVVLAGDCHAGKSTLVTRLSAGPVQLFCDDILPLVGTTAEGMALGIAPRLRLPLPAGASRAFRGFVADHLGPVDERYGYVLPPTLVPFAARAPIGALVILDRRRNGPAGLVPATRADALRHLIRRNLARAGSASEILDRLNSLLPQVSAMRLFYADIEEAAELLLQSFGAPPLAVAPTADESTAGEPIVLPMRSARADDGHRPGPVAADALFRARPDVGIRRVDQALFLTSAAEDAIFELNPLGAAVWRMLTEPSSVSRATSMLADAFPEIPPITIEADVASLFADFSAQGLVETYESKAA
jgi:hypothetical protein